MAHNGINNQYCKDSAKTRLHLTKTCTIIIIHCGIWKRYRLEISQTYRSSVLAHTVGVLRCQWQCAIQNSLLNEHAAAMDLCLCLCKYSMSGCSPIVIADFFHWQPLNTHNSDRYVLAQQKIEKIERNEHNGYAIHFDFAQLLF